jgi:thiamine-phosphate pyrophosphorylase
VPADAVAAARATMGAERSVGAACGGSYGAGLEAAEAEADYAWFCGDALGRDSVAGWAAEIVVPCVVAGGITAANAAGWAATGAEFVALGRAVWDAPEGPEAALRRLAATLAAG